MSSSRLVWSDDPKDKKCAWCKEFLHQCKCVKEDRVEMNKIEAIFRLETGGRGGKTVTVLDRLPRNETFLKDLCKEFKSKCGSGGTHKIVDKHGLIEIQGDKRTQMKAILEKKGIRFRGM